MTLQPELPVVVLIDPAGHDRQIVAAACEYEPIEQSEQYDDIVRPTPLEYLPAEQLVHAAGFVNPLLYVPAVHNMHADTPNAVENVPLPQLVQLDTDVMPDPVEYRPAAHFAHALAAFIPFKPVLYVPLAHKVQADCPDMLTPNVPGKQLVQLSIAVMPIPLKYLPWAQAVQTLNPVPVLYVPPWHSVQTDPDVSALNVPISQLVQLLADVMPSPLKYMPLPQLVQLLSLSKPKPVAYVPPGQFVQFNFTPEVALYVPAGHFVHTPVVLDVAY